MAFSRRTFPLHRFECLVAAIWFKKQLQKQVKPTIHILTPITFCYSPSFRLRIFIGILLFCSTVFSPLVYSAPLDSLKVVNWNLEFFGDIASQRAKEMKGTRTIMNHLNADIYALEEVVNVDSLHSLVQSINGNYQYLISPFGSFASSPSSNDYASAQKLAFIYRSEKVRNVSGRPFWRIVSAMPITTGQAVGIRILYQPR